MTAPEPVSPPVTAIVVSWNTADLLARCLQSLQPEAQRGRVAVHVVDNGSTDGSDELVADRFRWARLDVPGENLGFGRAVNRAAGATRSPWLLILNADVELREDALDACFAAAAHDPAAGAFAPRLERPDGTLDHSVHAFPTVGFTVLFAGGVAGVVPGLGDRLCLEGRWDPARRRRVPWAIAACLLVRRSAWDAAGGFDPDRWMYAEDLDLGWRLALVSRPTRFVPDAVAVHHGGSSTSQAFGDEVTARWLGATYDWIERTRGARAADAVAALNVAGARGRQLLARARRRPAWEIERQAGWASAHQRARHAGPPHP